MLYTKIRVWIFKVLEHAPLDKLMNGQLSDNWLKIFLLICTVIQVIRLSVGRADRHGVCFQDTNYNNTIVEGDRDMGW